MKRINSIVILGLSLLGACNAPQERYCSRYSEARLDERYSCYVATEYVSYYKITEVDARVRCDAALDERWDELNSKVPEWKQCLKTDRDCYLRRLNACVDGAMVGYGLR